jgi:hypothetical protein
MVAPLGGCAASPGTAPTLATREGADALVRGGAAGIGPFPVLWRGVR